MNSSEARPTLWRMGLIQRALLISSASLVLASNWKAIGWLWKSWTELPEFSHGPIMPLIAAFLLWQRHDRLERLSFAGSFWGLAIIGVSGIALIAGTVGAVYTLQQYAMLGILFGLVLSWTGLEAIKHLLMPFVVLALMIPQPEFILNQLSAKLQLTSSGIGVAMIRTVGISVFLEGNVIDLGSYKLQVVDACAGLRYLFPLMTIGLLVAYFFRAAMWMRWVVFLASIPVTILMNSFRIATVGLMVDRWGIGMAEGFIHDFQGWVVFMMSAALLIGLAATLNRLGGARIAWRDAFSIEMPAQTKVSADEYRRRPLSRAFVVAVVAVLVVCAAEVIVPERPPVIPGHPPLSTFPLSLSDWRGQSQPLAEEVIEASALDDYFFGSYQQNSSSAVSLYVSYYDSQRDRRVVHSPAVCLPGSGWHIVDSAVARPPGTGFVVNRILIANGDSRALVYYWFDQRGRFVTNEWMVKWYLFRDALLTRRTYGAMVRVLTPLQAGESIDKAESRLNAFLQSAEPQILTFIPR